MKYIKIILLLILAVSYNCVIAQEKKRDSHLMGHITDKETGDHIPYATIIVRGTNKGAISDATGHFMITDLKEGKYAIEASFVGYKSSIKEVTILKNKSTEIIFDLEIDQMAIDDIVVSSTRNQTKRKDSPTVVGVLSSKQFNITSSKNVAEALNFQPGLRVDYNCSNCGVPQLRINGLAGQYSQMLLDSRPIFSSLSAVYGLEQMPAGMIERVEVIRGGGSALFGSNAIGGVVNIITKEPVSNTLSVSNITGVLEGGKTDVNTTINGSFVSPDNKVGVYIFGMLRDREAYDRDNDGFTEIPTLNSNTLGFRGFYRTSENSKITIEYHNMKEFRRGGNNLDNPPHQTDITEQLNHNINGGSMKFDIFSSDYKHRFNAYASAQYIARDSYFGTHGNPNAYGKSNDMTANAGVQYTYSMKKLLFMPAEFTIGTEYNYNKLNDKMIVYDRDIMQKSISYGGYLQNEWKNKTFSLLIGARIDKHNKVNKAIISPRANIRYTPDENIILRASYSSGYRAPQAYDEDLHVAAVGGEVSLIHLATGLKPEYSNSYSASIDLYHTIGNFSGNLLIEGFHTRLKDVFTLEQIGKDDKGNILLERRNANGMKITGVNVETRINYLNKVNLQAGYTYQQSRYNEPTKWSESNEIAPQRTLLRSPDNYGYLSLNYNVTKKIAVAGNATYTGSMIAPHFAGYIEKDTEVKTPSFWDMGAKISYNFKLSKYLGFELSGGIKNILDSYQDDIDKGVDRDSKYIYGPNAPRTVFIGLKFTI